MASDDRRARGAGRPGAHARRDRARVLRGRRERARRRQGRRARRACSCVLCLFWVLLRIPFLAKEFAFSRRPPRPARMAKSYVALRVAQGRGRGCAVNERIRLPADVELEDRLAFGLTARQLLILAATAVICYAVFAAAGSVFPLPVAAVVAAPLGLLGVVLAFGRREGLSGDRLALAAVRHLSHPRLRVAAERRATRPVAWRPHATRGLAAAPPRQGDPHERRGRARRRVVSACSRRRRARAGRCAPARSSRR